MKLQAQEPDNAKKQFVHVYESDREFLVYPPVVVLDASGPGDDIELVNHTAEDLVWSVGPGLLGDAGDPVAQNVRKGGGKSGNKKPKSQGAGNAKLSTYQVFMIPSGKRAKGNSDPVIIVEN